MAAPRAHAHPPRTTARPVRRPWTAACALGAIVGLVAVAATTAVASAAATPVLLGTASPFAVLAATTVTNTGSSVLNGDLGVSPGQAITGFPPGLVNGAVRAGDAVAASAQADLRTGYDAAAAQPRDTTVSADLGGQVFLPGVHGSDSSLGLTGTVTLDAQGDPDAVFVFQAGSTLTTAAASRVLLINQASACNVFWQVGSSATLGASTSFAGSLLVLVSATLGNSTTVDGRVLARTGAVTLDADVVTRPTCATSTPGGTTPTAPASSPPGGTTAPTAPATGTPTTPAAGPSTTSPTPSAGTATPTGGGTAATPSGSTTGTTTTGTTTGRTTTPGTTTTTARTTGGGTTTRLTDGPAVTGGRPVVPRGAPATGGGGTAPDTGPPLLAAGLLTLLVAAAVAGLTGSPAPARHRAS